MGKIKNNPEFMQEEGGMAQKAEVLIDEELVREAQTPEPAEESAEPAEEAKAESAQEAPVESVQETPAEEPQLAPDLQALVEKGRRVQEWESKMPGFDVDQLVPEFTRRSQALKALERAYAQQESVKSEEPLPPEEMQVLEKALQRLGVPTRADITKSAQETQKDEFLARHPEYLPENDPGDKKWNQLLNAFNEYNWQGHPTKTYEFLERSHLAVTDGPLSPIRGARVQQAIQRKAATTEMASVGGGNAAPTASKAPLKGFTAVQREAYRRGGWTDAEIAELEGG